jgi:hypothetical protein
MITTILAAAAMATANDFKLADYKLQDEETLGPMKGAKSIAVSGMILSGEDFDGGLALLNYGMFLDRNWEPFGTIGLFISSSGGDSATDLLYQLGARYHFVGNSASKQIPYAHASWTGYEPDAGSGDGFFAFGAGINFFLKPQQSFFGQISFFADSDVNLDYLIEFGFRAFFK